MSLAFLPLAVLPKTLSAAFSFSTLFLLSSSELWSLFAVSFSDLSDLVVSGATLLSASTPLPAACFGASAEGLSLSALSDSSTWMGATWRALTGEGAVSFRSFSFLVSRNRSFNVSSFSFCTASGFGDASFTAFDASWVTSEQSSCLFHCQATESACCNTLRMSCHDI